MGADTPPVQCAVLGAALLCLPAAARVPVPDLAAFAEVAGVGPKALPAHLLARTEEVPPTLTDVANSVCPAVVGTAEEMRTASAALADTSVLPLVPEAQAVATARLLGPSAPQPVGPKPLARP